MGILLKFKNIYLSDADSDEIAKKGFDIADCPSECDDCNLKFPASVKVDDSNLWNSTAEYDLHLVVATGKADWPHDALGESGTFVHRLDKYLDKQKFDGLPLNKIKINPSSISSPGLENDTEYQNGTKGDILVLPHFVWMTNVAKADFDVFYDGLNQLINKTLKLTATSPLNNYKGSEMSITPDTSQSRIFLCSHRTRDKRCGITAPIMKKEFDMYTRDLGYYRDFDDNRADGIRVDFINHIGGHKYAANVIIYLKDSGKNIWLARCTPKNVKPIVDECILKDGKIWPEKVRLIQNFNNKLDW